MKNSNQKSKERCTFHHEILSNSLDGDIISIETKEHLQDCENCQDYLTTITSIHDAALKENIEEAPRELKLNVMSKIKVMSLEKEERGRTDRFSLLRVLALTFITLIPLTLLIAGFPLNKLLPLTSADASYALSPVTEFFNQSVAFISESGTMLTESTQSLISAFESAPILIPSLSFSTALSAPLIYTLVLLTLIVNLFLMTKGGNFQLLRERRTIHGFI